VIASESRSLVLVRKGELNVLKEKTSVHGPAAAPLNEDAD
jgi:hypothetical protein